MQTVSINGVDVDVTPQVASQVDELNRLPGILGVWPCSVNKQPGQVALATSEMLMLGMDSGPYSIPWGSVTVISSEGISTTEWSVSLDFGSGSNNEVLSWMAEYLCPEARAVSLAPSEGHMPYPVRSAEWRRARNRKMTDSLRATGGKWSNALEGSRFNVFSIVGTNDWEDYANAAMTAMTLESLTDLEERVEKLEHLLEEIRDLLADSPRSGP